MIRYAVFSYKTNRPGGGWYDNISMTEVIEDAKNIRVGINTANGEDKGHIVDLTTGSIVFKWDDQLKDWVPS